MGTPKLPIAIFLDDSELAKLRELVEREIEDVDCGDPDEGKLYVDNLNKLLEKLG